MQADYIEIKYSDIWKSAWLVDFGSIRTLSLKPYIKEGMWYNYLNIN
jgi:hypothetical protein